MVEWRKSDSSILSEKKEEYIIETTWRSTQWKDWVAIIDLGTCILCREKNGKIFSAAEVRTPPPPQHPRCRCRIEWMQAKLAGTATNNGYNGADWWLVYVGMLPDYYIYYEEALMYGWDRESGNLAGVLPGMMITRGVYRNSNGKLPEAEGRIWYEADINYTSGNRGSDRIVFSNDGLVFVTYNHYASFYDILRS